MEDFIIVKNEETTSSMNYREAIADVYEDEAGAVTVEEVLAMETSHEKCLLMNKVYQELITQTIQRLEIILEENLEQQEFIREGSNITRTYKRNLADVFSCKKSKMLAVFSMPYFRSRQGFVQFSNEDTKKKIPMKQIDPYMKRPRKWRAEEKETLRKAIRENILEHSLEPHLIRKQNLIEKLKPGEVNQEIKQKIRDCDEIMNEISNYDDNRLFSSQSEAFDWLKIATITFDGKRTATECKLMWTNYLSPTVNTKKWTTDEDSVLKATPDRKCVDWDSIAKSLNTNRTALQCFERFKTKFSRETNNRSWTTEHDETLVRLVNECRMGVSIPWHQVAYYCNRTTQEVYTRWKYCLDPSIKHGKWTEAEDILLVAGVMRYGENFVKICNVIPGRTNVQCRDRYNQSLKHTLTNRAWTPEEDKLLIQLVEAGHKWSAIIPRFPGRTRLAASKRYNVIVAFNENNENTDELPRSVSRSNDAYRKMIYHKVLRALRKEGCEDIETALTLTSEKELDAVIEKWKCRLQKDATRRQPPKMATTFSAEDKAFVEYFALVSNSVRPGRPFQRRMLEVKESLWVDEKLSIMHSLGGIRNQDQMDPTQKIVDCSLSGRRPYKLSTIQMSLLAPCSSNSAVVRFFSVIRPRLDQVDEEGIYCIEPHVKKRLHPRYIKDEKWHLLAKRFVSLFFMPALMTRIMPEEGVEVEIPPSQPKRTKRYNKPRVRKRRKPWVRKTNEMKKSDINAPEAKKKVEKVKTKVELPPLTTKGLPRKKLGRPKGAKREYGPVSRRSNRIGSKQSNENEENK